MTSRLRTTWSAAAGALILVLAIGGAAFAADTQDESTTSGTPDGTPPALVAATGTTAFVDADGDGIDDACETSVVADPVAAAAAEAALDTNGDGTVSVSEAAQSDRVGGANCNHGGYVSSVAKAQCDGSTSDEPATEDVGGTPTADAGTTESTDAQGDDAADENETDQAETDQGDQGDQGDQVESDGAATGDAAPSSSDCQDTQTATAPVPCVPVAAPVFDPATFTGPGAFGRYVATVAASDAIGGKNCNHGGAVSEAVKAAKDAAKAARDAAKAERKAQLDARKAERAALRSHGHGHGKGRGGNH